MEPCSGGKAAVLTVLLHLPSGPSGLPPPGQSGQTPRLGQVYTLFIIFSRQILSVWEMEVGQLLREE